jgi:hypothetical protein
MAVGTGRVQEIRLKHDALAPVLDERRMRLWAASEAKAPGRGGIATVTAATEHSTQANWHRGCNRRHLHTHIKQSSFGKEDPDVCCTSK